MSAVKYFDGPYADAPVERMTVYPKGRISRTGRPVPAAGCPCCS